MVTYNELTNVKRENVLQRAWAVVRANWRAYITINIVYYGLVLIGMVYVAFFNPGLQEELLVAVGKGFTEGPLAAVGSAYGGGQVLNAMVLTFLVNFFLGSLIQIHLPSLIIPFSGMLMGVIRAILWGLLLSPSNASLAGPMIPHSLVLLLEGQAYVMAMLAAFVHSKAFLKPEAYGITGHWNGYKEGLRRAAWIYLLVALLLLVAGVYEALEVIYLAPLFR